MASYYNSPIDSIYSLIKEIYSILSKDQKVLFEEDPIKGSKLLLYEIRGMLNGSITDSNDFGEHPHSEGNLVDTFKILYNLYTNGFDVKNESIDSTIDFGLIDRYAAKEKEIGYLDTIIHALFEKDLQKIETEAFNYADYYCKKVTRRRFTVPSRIHSVNKKQSNNKLDENFNLGTIVDDMEKNGVKLSKDSIEIITKYITSNPKLAKSDHILEIVSLIVKTVLGEAKEKTFMERTYIKSDDNPFQ